MDPDPDFDGFQTRRLTVRDWEFWLDDPAGRPVLVAALERMLTPTVLQHLPEPLQRANDHDSVEDWVDRQRGGRVFLVEAGGEIVGLLLTHAVPDETETRTIHLGYLFAEMAWGKGYATELLRGLVKNLEDGTPTTLLGGVAKGNDASARVLEKVGFSRSDNLSTADTDMFIRELS